jgi:hypothetical protein
MLVGWLAYVGLMAGIRRLSGAVGLHLSFCLLQTTLNARQEIEVVIYARRSRKLGLFHELGGVTFAIALCPLLVALVTWQRTCPRGTSGTAVLELGSVTGIFSQFAVWRFKMNPRSCI